MLTKKWDLLKKGDLIEVITPSFPINVDLNIIQEFIFRMGLVARIHPTNPDSKDPFSQNTDMERYEQVKKALYAEDSKAIWCFTGGYGATRIMPYLQQFTEEPQRCKLLIGYSDITALHMFIQQKWGWPSLHYKVIKQILIEGTEEEDSHDINKVLFTKEPLTYNLLPLNDLAKEHRHIESLIGGGNLSLVQCSIGTNWQFDPRNKILFFEDVDERGYRVDRILEQFKQVGLFNEAKAIIFGDFTRGLESDGTSKCMIALKRFAENIDLPVLSCPGIGHDRVSKPLYLGTKTILKLGEQSSLTCESGAK